MFRSRRLALMTLVSVLSLTAGAADSPRSADATTSAQVREFYAAWTAAFEKRDLKILMDMYHPAARYNMQGQPDQNHAELRATWAEEFKKPLDDMTWRPRIENIYVDGSMIVVVGTWHAAQKSSGGLQVVHSIRSVDVLTRSSRGLQILHTVNYPL